jgi:hypothetical protein
MRYFTSAIFTIPWLWVIFASCHSGTNNVPPTNQNRSFATRYNSHHEDVFLLLSCITYAEESTRGLNIDSVAGFYRISNQLGAYASYPASENVDSAIDAFLAENKSVNFNSKQAERRIYSFKQNYNTVSNIIFGEIEDSSEYKMKILEEKIDKVPGISKIYRLYVSKNRTLPSLASSEGSSLFIHLAYYFSIQEPSKRNEILKSLL